MEQLTIALDVEGVLSDTHSATAERSDFLDADNVPPENWQFPSKEHYDEFMHVSQNLWHNHNEQIPPLEPTIGSATGVLSEYHTVDVVTHRTNVPDQIQEWLSHHMVEYRDFYETTKYKTHVGDYDVHIDDSPVVVNNVVSNGRYMMLVEHEYNNSIEHQDRVWRVSGVTEAAKLLSDPTVVKKIRSA
jgi:hypothetical protein